MWRYLWRSIDRFSLNHFKYVINELRGIKVVDQHNKELVVDLLQSIVEIVTHGHKQDPMIFECFMEYQVLADFVRMLKICKNSTIEAPVLQYMSVLIQSLNSEHMIYYCFSNNYVNNIIEHPFEFGRGDLAQYYVSFLRAVSSKLNRDTICLLVKVQADAVVSFPLFDEALKFAGHEEKMIETAIRALTLNIYYVSDDMVYQYITSPPVSKYFSDLVVSLRDQCFNLDTFLHGSDEPCSHTKSKRLFLKADKVVDELYYLDDILNTGESRLSRLITGNLLNLLVLPALLSLMNLGPSDVSNLSAATSLYLLSRLLQIIGGKAMINHVAGLILYPYMTSKVRHATKLNTAEINHLHSSFFEHLNVIEEMEYSAADVEEENRRCPQDNVHLERNGISAFIDSKNHSLLLQSLFLLLVIAESKDLDCSMFPIIGLNRMNTADENFFTRFRDQILNALLKVLASQTPFNVVTKWHAGWFLRKLLIAQRKRLDDHNLELFNALYEQSCENLEKELDGCWFDHIMDTFRNEWTSCRTALEESYQRKDPLFALQLAVEQQTTNDDKKSCSDWQRMVDAVKVFVLHLQLKSYMFKGSLIEHPLPNPTPTLLAGSIQTHSSDISTASFGTEVSLVSGVPCKIAFSQAGVRDIYIIPVTKGTSGRLLLVEKHPFRSQRGVVLAIAPLAGLGPKIDEVRPMWLHLRIREFDPKFTTNKGKGLNRSDTPKPVADGKWTLGFQNAKDCDAARSLIVEETRKQRSNVESLLSPLFHYDLHQFVSNGQDE